MTPEELQQQLFDRWLTAFDEINQLPKYKKQAVKAMYGESGLFRLAGYEPLNFQPDRPLADSPTEMKSDQYGLDVSGKPCYTLSQYGMEGFYRYSDHLVEYLEFYEPLGILSTIQRLQFHQGKKVSYQSFSINGIGLGSPYAGKTKEQIFKKLFRDRNGYFSTIEQYHYEGDRIKRADCLYNMPGIGAYTSQEEYHYTDAGELDEILSIDQEGNRQYTYVKPPAGITLNELSEQVSQLLAADIVATIVATAPKSPLAIVELNYQEVGSYFPLLHIISDAYWKKRAAEYGEEALLEQVILSGDHPLTMVSFDTSERLMKAFIGEIEKSGDYAAARKMMYSTAWHLTTSQLNKQVAVSDEFIAYAVDWSMAPENVGEILVSCGMPEAQLQDWQKRGIL